MSLKFSPPFDLVLTLSGETTVEPESVSLKQLRDVVAGMNETFPRSKAMALLQASDFPIKHGDFEAVLENEEESPEIRYLAASYLGRINTPAAEKILIKNSRTGDEGVLVGVVTALGRIGGRSALRTVSRFKNHESEMVSSQAQFAAALISHRLGLGGHGLQVPTERDFLNLRRAAGRPIEITRAAVEDAELCLRSLADQPLGGIEFAESPAYQMRCGQRVYLLFFNQDFIGRDAIKKLSTRKAVLGIMALLNETSGFYSPALLLLSSPVKKSNEIDILIYHIHGELAFAGRGQITRNRIAFSIQAVSQLGAFAVKIEGTFEDGRLEFQTALTELFVRKQGRPFKGIRP